MTVVNVTVVNMIVKVTCQYDHQRDRLNHDCQHNCQYDLLKPDCKNLTLIITVIVKTVTAKNVTVKNMTVKRDRKNVTVKT